MYVEIGDSSALNALEALQAVKLLAHVVQVGFEVVIHTLLHSMVEAMLFLHVAVSEIMPLTWRQEIEFAQVVWGA